jgi:hypothetical protein
MGNRSTLVDRHLPRKLEIAKKIGAGFIVGIAVSYVTKTPVFIPLGVSLASYAFLGSVFAKPRLQKVNKKAEATVEPILYQLSNGLREGLSPERAIYLHNHSKLGGAQFAGQIETAIENGQPLSDVFYSLIEHVSSEGERRILSSIADTLNEDPRKAGQTLLGSLERIQRNRELRTERIMKIRSLLFRVKVLSVTCSTTLALIGALLPVLNLSNITRDWSQTAIAVTMGSSWTAAIVLSLTSGISSYYAASVALAERPVLYAVSSITIFWTIFLIASQLAY